MYLTLPLPSIQDVPFHVTLMLPTFSSSVRNFRGIQFGLTLRTSMSHSEVKREISDYFVEFVLDRFEPELRRVHAELLGCVPGTQLFLEKQEQYQSIAVVETFLLSLVGPVSGPGKQVAEYYKTTYAYQRMSRLRHTY